MLYAIEYAPAARRSLRKREKAEQSRVVSEIDSLAGDPRPDGCTKLVGHESLWRIRIGDLRVVYRIDDQAAAGDLADHRPSPRHLRSGEAIAGDVRMPWSEEVTMRFVYPVELEEDRTHGDRRHASRTLGPLLPAHQFVAARISFLTGVAYTRSSSACGPSAT